MKNAIVIIMLSFISFSAFSANLSSYSTTELKIIQEHNFKVLSFLEKGSLQFEEIVLESEEIITEINNRVPLDEEDTKRLEQILKDLTN